MADSPGRRRVLVVDDLADIRILIRRALSAGGYEVDVASTLAAAREMDPGGYDALLVDAHLGSERGIDLVEALLAEDPAAAGRCLVMTGGAAGPLPDGVASLTKPFQLDDLINAVGALHRPDAVPPPVRQADIPPSSGADAPESVSRREEHLAVGEPQAWQLLGLVRQLRGHERCELVDFLHDGPIQELTALTLELQMMSRSEPPDLAARSEAMLQRLNAATSSLRWLMDGAWPFLTQETQLAAALQQRTAWLLTVPVTVDTSPRPTVLDPTDVSVIVDIVELLLFVMLPAGQAARAHVVIRAPQRPIQIELTLTPATGDGGLTGDPATAQAALASLACALGASAQATLCDRHWQARIVLPGQADVPQVQ